MNNNRRQFIKTSAAVGAAALLPTWAVPRALAQDVKAAPEPVIAGKGKAKRLVILSLQGAPSHLDTFDPKENAAVKGEFKAIPTKVDGMQFAEHLPMLAGLAGDLCVVRSMFSKEGNHDRARYLTHTGHAPNPTVKHPTLGSIIAKELGKEDFELPHFVAIGGSPGDGGYLGPTFSALQVRDPEKGLENLDYRTGMTDERLKRRLKLREDVDKEFRKERNADIPDAQKAMYEKAKRMMDSKKVKAFDLSLEKPEVRDAYGRNKFGQGVLMARRLLDEGVSCVEVTQNGWDTHDNNFTRVKTLCDALDPAFAQLIKDLKARKMFDDTVILCFGEFGRTPKISDRGGRDHYPQCWSLVAAGGPFVRGKVVGSSDERGAAPATRPVGVPDLFWSLAHAFGYDAMRKFEVNDRPIWYSDKAGKVIPEFFA